MIGRIALAHGASVWFQCALRGDAERIEIGAGTNLQDGTICHADPGFPLIVGEGVTVGHRSILHGARIGGGALIGMGAVVMNGAVVGEQALLAAGALLAEGKEIPPRMLAAGVPARVVRPLRPEELEGLRVSAQHYQELAEAYRRLFASPAGNNRPS